MIRHTSLKPKREKPRRTTAPSPRIGKVDGKFRSPKLLKLAAKAPHCMMCHGGSEGEMVGCHSNYIRHGHGTGMKAHDLVLFACATCHDLLDGRKPGWDPMQKELAWSDGLFNTFLWLFQSGHLEVK